MINKTSILIVDDTKANIISLVALLDEQNLTIITANSGEEALKKILLNEIDIILLDVQMPGMSGFEVAEILRSRTKTENIPIIFITAINKEDYIFKGYDLGAFDFIYKPISNEILLSKVKVFIRLTEQKKIITHQNNLLKEKLNEIEKISNTDQLTGIRNRRGLDNNIKKYWGSCLRNNKYISFLMIDIDFFKGYNDSYGHVKGDETLRAVAQEILNSVKRPFDEVIRFGGEEFLVVLPDTPLKGAIQVSENIRQNIENLRIEHISSSISEYITVSVGGACMKVTKNTGSLNLLNEADSALYRAKDKGRNQVYVIEIN